jgi:hypothetical protein
MFISWQWQIQAIAELSYVSFSIKKFEDNMQLEPENVAR